MHVNQTTTITLCVSSIRNGKSKPGNNRPLYTVYLGFGFIGVYWGLTPQQQPGSYQGGEMMMMKSVLWWRKPEYPEETTDLRQVTDETG